MSRATQQFQEFYQAVHGTDLLSPLEKMFIGLAVTLTRTCEPSSMNVSIRSGLARQAGVSQETLDAVVAVVGAVNAGVCHAVAGRGYKQPDYPSQQNAHEGSSAMP